MQHARYRSTGRDRTRHQECAEMEPLPSMLYILYTINDKKVKFRILSAVKTPKNAPKTVFMPLSSNPLAYIEKATRRATANRQVTLHSSTLMWYNLGSSFGWHCEACCTACLPPSHLRRGINKTGTGSLVSMYIRTEKSEAIDVSHYKAVDVKPGEGTSWELIAKNSEDGSELNIATFEKVRDANKAKESLVEAINNGEAWDANEFKKSLEVRPRVFVTTTRSRL